MFYNDLITIGNRSIGSEYSDWKKAGIVKVSDIVKIDHSFKRKAELEIEYNITLPVLQCNKLISTLRSKIRNLPSCDSNAPKPSVPQLCLNNISKVQSKQVYVHIIKANAITPTSQNKWVEYYPFLETICWKKVYLLPFEIANSSYLITFQYKIIHRIFNCNYNLFVWNILDSPACSLCNQIDNIEHYFFYCHQSKFFWTQLEKWLSENSNETFKFTVLEVLLGSVNCNKFSYHMINTVILIGKYFIKLCKTNHNDMFFNAFLHTLKYFLTIEKNIYSAKNILPIFNERYIALFDKLNG